MEKVSTEAVVNNINGFHVRPSSAIVEASQEFECDITFFKKGESEPIDAKSTLDLIAAHIPHNQILIIECEGDDAEAALEKMKQMVEDIYDFKDAHPV